MQYRRWSPGHLLEAKCLIRTQADIFTSRLTISAYISSYGSDDTWEIKSLAGDGMHIAFSFDTPKIIAEVAADISPHPLVMMRRMAMTGANTMKLHTCAEASISVNDAATSISIF